MKFYYVYRNMHHIPRTRVGHSATLVTERCNINVEVCRATYGIFKFVALKILYSFKLRNSLLEF
jgi:hypothetical protein